MGRREVEGSPGVVRWKVAVNRGQWMCVALGWRLTWPLRAALGWKRNRSSPRVVAGSSSVSADDYQRYVIGTATRPSDGPRMQAAIRTFAYLPTISVVLPIRTVPISLLERAIRSVLAQAYPNWQLCIVHDGTAQPEVAAALLRYGDADPRITVLTNGANVGVSSATNRGLAISTGEYLAFLDEGDELASNALFDVVEALQLRRWDILYSDEDRIDSLGRRSDPYFKPDFDEELLLWRNYMKHLAVIRRDLLNEVGGFRSEHDGAHDYDVVLRLTDTNREICHIPRVLYHAGNTTVDAAAASEQEPMGSVSPAERALTDTLDRRGIHGEVVDGLMPGVAGIRCTVICEPTVTIIIPFRDHSDVTMQCLQSIFRSSTYTNFEILLVNNQSSMDTMRTLREFTKDMERVAIFDYPHDFNYSAINNFAVGMAKGEYLVLLNNDTEVIAPGWIEALLEYAQRPEVGAVGAKLHYLGGQIQHAGGVVGTKWRWLGAIGLRAFTATNAFAGQPGDTRGHMGMVLVPHSASFVTFACVMVRRSLYQELGGLDARHSPVALSDTDFCLRLREKGYAVIYTPYAILFHHESLSRGRHIDFEAHRHFNARHAAALKAGDPFYNDNFSEWVADFRTLRSRTSRRPGRKRQPPVRTER